MSKKVVPVVALALVGAGLSLIGLRMWEAREFSRRCEVRTDAGTNYVAQLVETTVGRADNGCVVIVYARLLNPNPFELELQRDAFVLDTDGHHHWLPSTSGTQTKLIKLAPGGVSEREAFSFSVPEDSFRGEINLQIGKDYRVMVKNKRPYELRLRNGQFHTFRRREW
jgi:hypothetical protein